MFGPAFWRRYDMQKLSDLVHFEFHATKNGYLQDRVCNWETAWAIMKAQHISASEMFVFWSWEGWHLATELFSRRISRKFCNFHILFRTLKEIWKVIYRLTANWVVKFCVLTDFRAPKSPTMWGLQWPHAHTVVKYFSKYRNVLL